MYASLHKKGGIIYEILMRVYYTHVASRTFLNRMQMAATEQMLSRKS